MPWAFSLEIALMEETGWSWRELMETPYPVVQTLAVRLNARNRAAKEKRVQDAAEKAVKDAMNRMQGRR